MIRVQLSQSVDGKKVLFIEDEDLRKTLEDLCTKGVKAQALNDEDNTMVGEVFYSQNNNTYDCWW
jgi:hypothetical protein